MNDVDLAKYLHAARDTVLALHKRDSEALRRKLYPDELIASCKQWAERLLDVATINPGPSKLRSSSDFNRKSGPAIYAEEISAAQSILDIIAELKQPMAILLAFKRAFPTQFASIKCVLPFIRTVVGKNGVDVYFFYRRQGKNIKPAWERRLPDDPTSEDFMTAYRAAEAAFERFMKPTKSYHREPATAQLAA
jgi:hypothetical protein